MWIAWPSVWEWCILVVFNPLYSHYQHQQQLCGIAQRHQEGCHVMQHKCDMVGDRQAFHRVPIERKLLGPWRGLLRLRLRWKLSVKTASYLHEKCQLQSWTILILHLFEEQPFDDCQKIFLCFLINRFRSQSLPDKLLQTWPRESN